ncbi:hypothetical protein CLOM_g12246 [Closterium sp. NIES-68]|nr:hypothetical protein CLOM_g12246 [Closterium sp. NIES-68]GJP63869.1 hypothetical protein CLOP_g20902 [Closterium sp. NIES-67]
MALLFRAAQRTSSTAHRAIPRLLPLLDSFLPLPRRAASSVAPSPPVAPVSASSAPSVADRAVHFTAIDADGQRHAVTGLAGRSLLSALIRAKVESAERHQLEELESCNGNCQVSIAQEWQDKLPPRTQAEEDRLRQVATDGQVARSSRLGCQVHLSKDLEGMTVAMAEERPWYTL